MNLQTSRPDVPPLQFSGAYYGFDAESGALRWGPLLHGPYTVTGLQEMFASGDAVLAFENSDTLLKIDAAAGRIVQVMTIPPGGPGNFQTGAVTLLSRPGGASDELVLVRTQSGSVDSVVVNTLDVNANMTYMAGRLPTCG
jgi:hypothetical protein